MKDNETDAAEYALGVLTPKEREHLVSSADQDSDLGKYIDAWQAGFSKLSEAVDPVAPPAQVWQKLERRIGPENTTLPRGVEAVPYEKGGWWKFGDGVDVKSLFIDDEQDTESFLLRIEAGCQVEPHHHDGFHDECIVVEGDISVGDVRFGPGDFHVATSGSVHPPLSSERGGILFVRSKRITYSQTIAG